MEKFIVEGGYELNGRVKISAGKNSCLPIIASTAGFGGEFLLKGACPIGDIKCMCALIESLGGNYAFVDNGLKINTKNLSKYYCDDVISKMFRASFFTVGALLSRFKRANLPLPGGCNIGARPVDIHLNALKQLGVSVEEFNGRIFFNGENMHSGKVKLSYPSVGATVNLICATVFLKGESVLINTAKEPEIVDLCNFLNVCGCKIYGVGSGVIKVQGVTAPKFITREYAPFDDRIEAGTFACAVAIAKGDIVFKFDNYLHIKEICNKLKKCGVTCDYKNGEMRVFANKKLKPISVTAKVYPAFPTDMQSLICCVSAFAKGRSVITDRVFCERFQVVKELQKMGVRAIFRKGSVVIYGGNGLKGTKVNATDLRGGASLICAGLGASGITVVENAKMVERGYFSLDGKLKNLGAKISFIK